MASRTLSQLTGSVRERTDEENSDFVSDAELANYVNQSISSYMDVIISSDSDHYLSSSETTMVAGQSLYDLPSDFLHLRGVDIKYSDQDFYTLEKFNFQERNKYKNNFNYYTVYSRNRHLYRLYGSEQIKLIPDPQAAATLTVWYYYQHSLLTGSADAFSFPNGHEEYVIVDSAIKVLQKNEEDIGSFMAERSRLENRIKRSAERRDSMPSTILDVENMNGDGWNNW